VSVFDREGPFLGFTETMTLQEPTFRPLIVVPVTLQFLEVDARTFNEIFEPAKTDSFA
jgi:hypothetical protein